MVNRPLPWHDTPKCRERKRDGICGGPIVMDPDIGLSPCCGACGTAFHPTHAEREQIRRAEAAWDAVLRGDVHEDKACARCNGPLPIDRFRLCASCVEKDNAERQVVLF